VSERIDGAVADAQSDPVGALERHPWLGAAIDADAAAGRFARWGRSTVIDEHAGTAVVPEALFDALHARAGLDAAWPIGNAGLLHIYGYLLSTVPTPYGFKRERWLNGALARAYGLPADAFVPWASSRTTLERVTDAMTGLLARAEARTAVVGDSVASLGLARHADGGPFALAYALGGRLVTTFPVGSADEILAEWDAEPARPRWNAVL